MKVVLVLLIGQITQTIVKGKEFKWKDQHLVKYIFKIIFSKQDIIVEQWLSCQTIIKLIDNKHFVRFYFVRDKGFILKDCL